jgi:hypothetical protein
MHDIMCSMNILASFELTILIKPILFLNLGEIPQDKDGF